MKLNQVLSHINQVERAKFVSCLDKLCLAAGEDNDKLTQSIAKINGQIKTASGSEITQLFNAVSPLYKDFIKEQLSLSSAQTAMLINILSRDGNSVARTSWIETLYTKEWDEQKALSDELVEEMEKSTNDSFDRGHRNNIYKACFDEAYTNDERVNRQAKVTDDERGILNVLAKQLNIPTDEAFAIEHILTPAPKNNVIDGINELRDMGILFINRKRSEVIIADEIVAILHEIEDKELKDKHLLRILRTFSETELTNVLKQYGKKSRGMERKDKILNILHAGVAVSNILSRDMFSATEQVTVKKERLKTLIADLGLTAERIGTTLEDRINVIVQSLKNNADDEFNALSASGFTELIKNLQEFAPTLLNRLHDDFEIEQAEELNTEHLRALGITPLDILYVFSNAEIKQIRDDMGLAKRGDPRFSILTKFANANDKLIENYTLLAARDLAGLKQAGVDIAEADIGVKFEEITKSILEELNLNVNEDLRKSINTAKDKIDILISLSDDDVIIGEAKTCKEGDFAKYSATSRQVKAYVTRCENSGKRVAQVLIVAPSFSTDFIESAEMDTEVNISLLEATGLKTILEAYKSRRNPNFSPKLLTKGGLLKANLIAKNI